MSTMHKANFRILDAMAAIERAVGHQLGFGPSRSLTTAEEQARQAGAEAAVEAWQDAKHRQPDLEPRTDLERLCAEFTLLQDNAGHGPRWLNSGGAPISP
ncbi:hypothetical protein GUJ75_23755|nr:hypothetical protein [Escherichia coli]